MTEIEDALSGPDRTSAESMARGLVWIVDENGRLRDANQQLKDELDGAYGELDTLRGCVVDTAQALGIGTYGKPAEELADGLADRVMGLRDRGHVPGPVERALRDEWAEPGHGCLSGGFGGFEFINFASDVTGAIGKLKPEETVTGIFFRELLDELGEPREDEEHGLADGLREQMRLFGMDVSDCDCASDLLHNLNGELSKRLMPEGYSWPRFEDGEPVRIGDVVSLNRESLTVRGITFYHGTQWGYEFALEFFEQKEPLYCPKETLFRRPAPVDEKTSDATNSSMDSSMAPSQRQPENPVKTASGAETSENPRHTSISDENERKTASDGQSPDSWERLDYETGIDPVEYCRKYEIEVPPDPDWSEYTEAFAADLLRRAKALAGVSE